MITIGLFDPGYIKNKQLVDKLRELTYFYVKNSAFRGNVNEAEVRIIDCVNGEDALNASKTEYTFLLAVGNIVSYSFFDVLMKYIEEDKPDFSGHILQTPEINGTSYFFPHLQSFLIKTEHWNNFDKKNFGVEGNVTNLELTEIKRSEENIHDDYTPNWIAPGLTKQSYTGYLNKGYNIFNQFGKINKLLYAFPPSIRNEKKYLYAENDNRFADIFLNNTKWDHNDNLLGEQIDFLNKTEVKNYKDSVFVYNTDDPKEVLDTQFHLEHGLKKESYKKEKIDNLYCIAAGFFACNFLHLNDWDNDTKVIYFDINKKALNFKKWLNEYWDGRDYLSILKYYRKNVEDLTPIWHGQLLFNEEEEYEFQKQKIFFGGTEKWLEFWNKYRKLDHTYIELDLIQSPDELLIHLESNKDKKNLTYVSNIFYSELVLRLFSPDVLKQRTDYFVNNAIQHTKLMGTKNRFKWITQ
tara:strand:+ start:645 stop:2042 length:1398 start_codon:yes stop_codon:yes gene_type:complete